MTKDKDDDQSHTPSESSAPQHTEATSGETPPKKEPPKFTFIKQSSKPTLGGGSESHCNHHGEPCSHHHHQKPSETPSPAKTSHGNNRAVLWGAGILATIGVGSYLINAYGKQKRESESITPNTSWKARLDQQSLIEPSPHDR